jgi:hypothetical protein
MVFSLLVGAGLLANLTCADAWYPELFMRSWGWSATQAGRVNGAASLISDRWACGRRRDGRDG